MKKRRSLLCTLLALLLIFGIPMGCFLRAARSEQASLDLLFAIKTDDTENALAALKAGADPNTRDHSGDKPLPLAQSVKRCFNKIIHPNAKEKPDLNPTVLRLCFRRLEGPDLVLVTALLNAGADPNYTLEERELSPLMVATIFHDLSVKRVFIQHGSSLQYKTDRGRTVIHTAAICDDAEGIPLMLDAGADVNAQDKNGETPLVIAVRNGKLKAVQALLKHHANPNLRNRYGYTVLQSVSSYPKSSVFQLLRKAGAKTSQELDAEAKH